MSTYIFMTKIEKIINYSRFASVISNVQTQVLLVICSLGIRAIRVENENK